MKRYISLFSMLILAAFVMTPDWAQAGSGFYISSDIGLNIASGLDTTGFSNDRASVCDEYINPTYDQVEGFWGRQGVSSDNIPNCTGPNRGATGGWQNEFDSATGILAGAAVGYSFAKENPNSPLGGLRVELEYFYRQSKYDQTSDVPSAEGESGDKLQQELVTTVDRIGNVASHNLFANLFYDFVNTSRFTPYVGAGVGFGVTDMEYGSLWARNSVTERILTGGDPDKDGPGTALPNADEIRRNLTGTSSVAQRTLNDTLFGFQILFGVDYAVTEAMSLGLKGRWARFGSFEDDGVVWDPLRGHPPYLRRGGSDREHVSGGFRTDNMQFFGVSLNLKYHF